MRAVIIGGSIAGLTSAMTLCRAGIDVIVLDADDSSPSESLGADLTWPRRGVPQHTQAHAFLSLFVKTFREIAPDVVEDLVRLGAVLRTADEIMPSAIKARAIEIDDDLSEIVAINARRPFVESVLRRHVLEEPNIDFRSPFSVRGVTHQSLDGHPHVTGVVADSGESITADIVLDASGRRSRIDEWLREAGNRGSAYAAEPTNQLYFTRYYRLLRNNDLPPLNNGFVTVNPFPWFAVLMFPGDNGTLQLAMGCLPEDVEMKRLRLVDAFHRVAKLAPAIAPWVDSEVSEPISDVSAMGNLNNYVRRMVVDGKPVATGIHLVGDSAMITNPQYGRGVSHAAGHGAFVARVVIEHPDDPIKQALALDQEVERMLVPSFESSLRLDRMRTAAWRDFLGFANLKPASGINVKEPSVDAMKAGMVMMLDPVVWVSVQRGGFLLEPPGSWADDPEVVERIAAAQLPDSLPPPPPNPDRQTILDAL